MKDWLQGYHLKDSAEVQVIEGCVTGGHAWWISEML
jgi:hypothetical protein